MFSNDLFSIQNESEFIEWEGNPLGGFPAALTWLFGLSNSLWVSTLLLKVKVYR